MPRAPFHYHVGNVHVDYDPNGVTTIKVPGKGRESILYILHGMKPNAIYAVEPAPGCRAAAVTTTVAAEDGRLAFQHRLSDPCGVTIRPAPAALGR